MSNGYPSFDVVDMPEKFGRFMIVDSISKDILDDAQGYGYKSREKAIACFLYKRDGLKKPAECYSRTR